MGRFIKPAVRPPNNTRSVQVFIQRVKRTFIALFVLGLFLIFTLIYLPLNNALEESLIKNFRQISFVNYQSLQNSMQRGLEGARSLSSRTMIKSAILDYRASAMSFDALKAYTQPKFEEGARALALLTFAERIVDGGSIARYAPLGEGAAFSCLDTLTEAEGGGAELASTLCQTDEYTYFIVRSLIVSEDEPIGYDNLIFDLTGHIRMLCSDTTQTELLQEDAYEAFKLGAKPAHNCSDPSIAFKAGFYYHVIPMEGGVYFVSKQSESALFEPIRSLSVQISITGIGMLLAFTVAVYLYVVRFARKELTSLERKQRTLRKVASEANTDPLSEAGSRRYGEEMLKRAFESYKAGNFPSPAIILFDIDKLKQINDAYGHSAGDAIIRGVAQALLKNTRNEDGLFRWGGDEFVGVFYGLKEENMPSFAQKLLDAVSALRIHMSAARLGTSISMGSSYFKKGDASFLDALNRADRAMYKSKSDGRNKANLL